MSVDVESYPARRRKFRARSTAGGGPRSMTRMNQLTVSPVSRSPQNLYASRLLLAVVDDLVVVLDDVFLRLLLATGSWPGWPGLATRGFRRGARARCLVLGIERLPGLAVRLAQLLLRGANLVRIVATNRLARTLDSRIQLRLHLGRQLVGPLLGVLLDLVRHAVETIAGVDLLATLLVLGRVLFGVLHHATDVGIRETARGLDSDLLFLAGR